MPLKPLGSLKGWKQWAGWECEGDSQLKTQINRTFCLFSWALKCLAESRIPTPPLYERTVQIDTSLTTNMHCHFTPNWFKYVYVCIYICMYICVSVSVCIWVYIYVVSPLFQFPYLQICPGILPELFFYFTLNLGWRILNSGSVLPDMCLLLECWGLSDMEGHLLLDSKKLK